MNFDSYIEQDNLAYYSSLNKSDSVSEMSDSQGLIIESLDGTYYQGIAVQYLGIPSKIFKKPISLNEERKDDANNILENYPRNRILYIVDEDEIAVYSGFNQLPIIVDDFLELYLKHSKYFMIGLIAMMICEVILWNFGYIYKENAINRLVEQYKTNNIVELSIAYNILLWGELGYLILYYIFGILAAYQKSVKLYVWFAYYSLIGLIFEMVLISINRFDVLIFIVRFIAFIYSRFLSQLLISLLLLPRQIHYDFYTIFYIVFIYQLCSPIILQLLSLITLYFILFFNS